MVNKLCKFFGFQPKETKMDLSKIMDEVSFRPMDDTDEEEMNNQVKAFLEAFISNDKRLDVIKLGMMEITKKTMSLAAVANSKKETTEAVKSFLFNKPIIGLIYYGYLIGLAAEKSKSEADALEAMFADRRSQ